MCREMFHTFSRYVDVSKMVILFVDNNLIDAHYFLFKATHLKIY